MSNCVLSTMKSRGQFFVLSCAIVTSSRMQGTLEFPFVVTGMVSIQLGMWSTNSFHWAFTILSKHFWQTLLCKTLPSEVPNTWVFPFKIYYLFVNKIYMIFIAVPESLSFLLAILFTIWSPHFFYNGWNTCSHPSLTCKFIYSSLDPTVVIFGAVQDHDIESSWVK